jgi:hypothetical protein
MDTKTDLVRLEIIKEELTQLKAQNATIMTQQAEILQKLGGTTTFTYYTTNRHRNLRQQTQTGTPE